MRMRILFLTLSVASLSAAAVAVGCGDTDDGGSTTPDSGTDAAKVPNKPIDSGPDEEEDAAPCDTSKDLAADIPDADIFDGASTTGLCLGCINDNCQDYVDECTQNCECQEIATKALDCYLKSGDLLVYGADVANANVSKATQNTLLGLLACLNASCEDECQTKEFDAGTQQDGGDGG